MLSGTYWLFIVLGIWQMRGVFSSACGDKNKLVTGPYASRLALLSMLPLSLSRISCRCWSRGSNKKQINVGQTLVYFWHRVGEGTPPSPDRLSSFCQHSSHLPWGAEQTGTESGFPWRAIVRFPWAPRKRPCRFHWLCFEESTGLPKQAGEKMLFVSLRLFHKVFTGSFICIPLYIRRHILFESSVHSQRRGHLP